MVSEDGSEATAFDGYVEALIEVIGHADRAEPLRDYCTGLMMPVARKSVEPLAAVTAPSRVSAKHQSLLHFVGQAPWSDEALMARVRDWALPRMIERGGPITAWIIELGLGHYEGRGWRGFHHHASLCIAAYGFLLSERETIPPSALARPQSGEKPPIPRGSRSDTTTHPARTPHLKFDRDGASEAGCRPRSKIGAMSLLRPTANSKPSFVTQ